MSESAVGIQWWRRVADHWFLKWILIRGNRVHIAAVPWRMDKHEDVQCRTEHTSVSVSIQQKLLANANGDADGILRWFNFPDPLLTGASIRRGMP